MFVGVIKTDGGAHPPEKWAYISAAHIVDIFRVDPSSPREIELEMAKDMLRAKITQLMIAHFKKAQDGERGLIKTVGHDRILVDINPAHADHMDSDAVAQEIVAAFDGSVLKEFLGADQVAAIKERVETDCRTIMHIEHGWHADRHPMTDQAKAFRAKYHPGIPMQDAST